MYGLFTYFYTQQAQQLGKNLRHGRGKMSKEEVIRREEKGEHRKEN